jgi:hypothetical protein
MAGSGVGSDAGCDHAAIAVADQNDVAQVFVPDDVQDVLNAALCLQAGTGFITREVIWFALLAFPGTIFGAWLGARAYRVLSDRNFRDVVLGLLFLSGVGLVWSSLGLR